MDPAVLRARATNNHHSRARRKRQPAEENDCSHPASLTQWQLAGNGTISACGPTVRRLPAGAYVPDSDLAEDRPFLRRKNLQVDDMIPFSDNISSQILREIEAFWSLGERFRSHGYLHRRGFLLYGPQGSGKSAIVHQVVHQIIHGGHLAAFCDNPEHLIDALALLRTIEPQRPVVCVFEDIDATIDRHGDGKILEWLDGCNQVDRVVSLATTNYPEKLDRRIVARPRRFDRIIKIDMPSDAVRRAYLARKLPELEPGELAGWVQKTEGFSFAALAELIISVACLGNTLDETVELLQQLDDRVPSSREFNTPGSLGFSCRK